MSHSASSSVSEPASAPPPYSRLPLWIRLKAAASTSASRWGLARNPSQLRILKDRFIPWEVVEAQLDILIEASPKYPGICSICGINEQCMFICFSYICPEQVKNNVHSNNGYFQCYSDYCSASHDLGMLFRAPKFSKTLDRFSKRKTMLNNINVQKCSCGTLMLNKSLSSKQQCPKCNRFFCFFCNKDWDSGMVDQKYSCGRADGCEYQTRIGFELVPFGNDSSWDVPNRRCCPKCFYFGSYDERCKYHSCLQCYYTFCFVCLKSSGECQRTYNSNHNHKCTDPVFQQYEDFPHYRKWLSFR